MAKGAKPRGEYANKSSVFSTRIRPDLRKKLDDASAGSGRSLSQEIEHRLRRTFVEDDRIEDIFGDRQTFQLMRMVAQALQTNPQGKKTNWLENADDFHVGVRAALLVLSEACPPDESLVDPWDAPFDLGPDRTQAFSKAQEIAFQIWDAVKNADPAPRLGRASRKDHQNAVIKADLRAVLERVHPNLIKRRKDILP